MIAPDIDFRNKFPNPHQQGLRNSCLAFSTTNAHEHTAGTADPFCVEYLFYNASQKSGFAPDGCTMSAMQAALATEGQPLETYWPYLAAQPSPSAWTAPPGLGQVWKSNSKLIAPTLASVSNHLLGGNPVILGLIVTNSFRDCGSDGILPSYNPDQVRGGHAVLAVGLGNDGAGHPHLLIRNSWGSNWGWDGHAWLGESYVGPYLHEAMILVK